MSVRKNVADIFALNCQYDNNKMNKMEGTKIKDTFSQFLKEKNLFSLHCINLQL